MPKKDEKKSDYNKKPKETRIKAEVVKIKKIYKECDDKIKKIAEPLVQNLAFMTVTLEDLRDDINENGCISEYKNGENQYGFKKSPAVETYNTMIKNYSALYKQLTDLIPKPEMKDDLRNKSEDDGFDEFVAERQ